MVAGPVTVQRLSRPPLCVVFRKFPSESVIAERRTGKDGSPIFSSRFHQPFAVFDLQAKGLIDKDWKSFLDQGHGIGQMKVAVAKLNDRSI
jgi:hypothetical protein